MTIDIIEITVMIILSNMLRFMPLLWFFIDLFLQVIQSPLITNYNLTRHVISNFIVNIIDSSLRL